VRSFFFFFFILFVLFFVAEPVKYSSLEWKRKCARLLWGHGARWQACRWQPFQQLLKALISVIEDMTMTKLSPRRSQEADASTGNVLTTTSPSWRSYFIAMVLDYILVYQSAYCIRMGRGTSDTESFQCWRAPVGSKVSERRAEFAPSPPILNLAFRRTGLPCQEKTHHTSWSDPHS
jgi:hypothetical protein